MPRATKRSVKAVPARARVAPISMRRCLTGRDIIQLLRIAGWRVPTTARVYIYVSHLRIGGLEIDIDADHPVIVSTKAYDRKDR